MNFGMKVEARLKRASSMRHKTGKKQLRSSSIPFPGVWGLQCFAYDSLKSHMREFSARKQMFKDEPREDITTESSKWEQSFKTRLDSEITKINVFYDERFHECEDGLKHLATDIPNICTIKSPAAIHVWHDFILFYCNTSKVLERRELSPTEFVSHLEGHLVYAAEKPIDSSILSVLQRLVLLHKLSLQLKSFTDFNITGLKKLLRKHDENTESSISTEWMDRIHHESFCIHDPFQKIVARTKEIMRSLTPSTDEFSCAICLGLLCKPVVTPCGHVFCQHCTELSASFTFCPMCRAELQLNHSNPDKQLKTYLKHHFPVEYKATQKEHKASKRKIGCIIS